MQPRVANRRLRQPGPGPKLTWALLAALLAACAPQPPPRTVFDFMEDGHAREGVLTRCNRDRDATLSDEECVNARRAAAAIALEAERARAGELERRSEAKLLALREQEAIRAAAEREAEAAARAAAAAAYEARWANPEAPRTADEPALEVPVFGAPLGTVLPSIDDSTSFDVYADGAEALGRPGFEAVTAEPPPNELFIPEPTIEVSDLAAVPRPFRDSAAQ